MEHRRTQLVGHLSATPYLTARILLPPIHHLLRYSPQDMEQHGATRHPSKYLAQSGVAPR